MGNEPSRSATVSEKQKQLRRLVDDDEKLDDLLSLITLEDAADAWWRYTVRSHAVQSEGRPTADDPWDTDPDSWAIQLWFGKAIHEREETVRQFLHLLAERAPAEGELSYLGAGPVEDFVCDDEERLLWIEEEASRSPNFRGALANVWAWRLPPEIFLRLERAARVPLSWPPSAGPRPGSTGRSD
jgi:hypothetical protein